MTERAHAAPWLAAIRAAAALIVTGWYISGWLLRRGFLNDVSRLLGAARCTEAWLRSLVRILGIRVTTAGTVPAGPALIAPNHSGYCDVLALGSVVPCHFVAKAEVEAWPVVGFLFAATAHLGISRRRDASIRTVTDAMTERLRRGDRFCVFLEGTSTAGDRVLPFRSPLVQPAIDAAIPVVPAAIRWSAGRPDIDIAEDVAYWKDHVFGPHVWRLLGLTTVRAHIVFGDAVFPEGRDRKALARAVEERVAALGELPRRDERGDGYVSPVA